MTERTMKLYSAHYHAQRASENLLLAHTFLTRSDGDVNWYIEQACNDIREMSKAIADARDFIMDAK